jgi:DNA-binding winged helix-turn-helix (wHTH) protein
MKSFKAFRLDTANHVLSRDGDRVPISPKGFDVLAYLVEHAGQVVTQDEILEALWPETHVNPEVLRKCILEIRKALGDRAGNPNSLIQCLSGDTNLSLKVFLP